MCTSVMVRHNDSYFCRNMDNYYSINEKMIIVPKNYIIKFKKEESLKFHYAFMGIGTIIDNYPLLAEGINEAHLALSALNFPNNAKYYQEDKNKANLAIYELILYILATCGGIEDVKKTINNINVINCDFSTNVKLTPLHLMVSDLTSSIVIETTAEGMKVYDNPFNVLTNNPPFTYHLENVKNYMNLSTCDSKNNLFQNKLEPYSFGMGLMFLPGDYSSTSRFVKALAIKDNLVLTNNEIDNINQLFYLLNSVFMIKGVVNTKHGFEYSQYNCVINMNKCMYYYKTYENPTINCISLFEENLNNDKLIYYHLSKDMTINIQNKKRSY